MYKKACVNGCVAGLVLYLLTVIEDVLFCSYALSDSVTPMLLVYFLLGLLVGFITVARKTETIGEAGLRFAVVMVVFALCVIIGGGFQLIPMLRSALGAEVNSYVDNLSGLVFLSFLAAVAVGCVIALLAVLIKKACKREF